MCICFYTLKQIREATGNDALWAYDPGPPGTPEKYATHATGPAPSMKSAVCFSDVSGTLGAIVDVDGYLTTQFSVSGVTLSQPMAAWNGTSAMWIADRTTSPTWRAFDLSGSLLGSFTGNSLFGAVRFAAACDSSGNLIVSAAGATQQRSTSGTALNSVALGGLVAVDSSDNVFLVTGTEVRKYNSSFALQWNVSLPSSITLFGAVCDSSGNLLITYYNSFTVFSLRKYSSSGSVSWTTTLPYSGSAARTTDLWCDGANVYILASDNSNRPLRMKYDSSGSQVWQEDVLWQRAVSWDTGEFNARTIRGNGSLITLAGLRQT